MNFFVKQLYRLEYAQKKFRVVLGIIQALSYFFLMLSTLSNLTIPLWSILLALVVGIPLLIAFTYIIELMGSAWQEDKWTDFHIRTSNMYYDKLQLNYLLDVRSYRMGETDRIKQLETAHDKLSLDDISIELEVLYEVKKLKEKNKSKEKKTKS